MTLDEFQKAAVRAEKLGEAIVLLKDALDWVEDPEKGNSDWIPLARKFVEENE